MTSSTFEITRENLQKYFWKDFLSSVVVFLVALPLCMGVAIASGLPVASGIMTGIVGGMIVGFLSGCPLQVSGPAAGLVVVVIELIQQHGLETLGVIFALAGMFQIAAGFFGLGQWFRAVPPSVIHGMLSGIGLLLMLGQFHVMLDDTPKSNAIQNLISIPAAIWKAVSPLEGTSHHIAAAVGVSTILLVVLWDKVSRGWLKHVPGALIAIVAVTMAASVTHLPVKYVDLPENLLTAIRLPGFESFKHIASWELLLDALAVAFVATAETMLTATAVDKMRPGHRTRYDREMKAQGIGNVLCGLIGAMPMTGVIVRSGVNVRVGAQTRLSTVLHGLWLLVFVTVLPWAVQMVPIASLAALLVLTGFKLLVSAEAKELRRFGKSEVAIYGITLISIVAIDLLTGVLIGVILSIAKLLYIFSHLDIKVVREEKPSRNTVFLRGAATFLSLPKLASALEELPTDAELHVHLEELDYIDHACLDLLMNWDKQHRNTGGNLVIDWGTLGAMFRDRRRRPRTGAARTKEMSPPEKEMLLGEIIESAEVAEKREESPTPEGS